MDNLKDKGMHPVEEAPGEKSHIYWVLFSHLEAQRNFVKKKPMHLGLLKTIPDLERSAFSQAAQEQSGWLPFLWEGSWKQGSEQKHPTGERSDLLCSPAAGLCGPRVTAFHCLHLPDHEMGIMTPACLSWGSTSSLTNAQRNPSRRYLGRAGDCFVLIPLIFYLTLITKAPGGLIQH